MADLRGIFRQRVHLDLCVCRERTWRAIGDVLYLSISSNTTKA